MPILMVSPKDGAPSSAINDARKQVEQQGGKIVHESKLTGGFHAEMPSDKVHTLESNKHIDVERDSEVKTQ